MSYNALTMLRSMDAAPDETTIDMNRASRLREDILRTSAFAPKAPAQRGIFHSARQKVVAATALSGAAAAMLATLSVSGSSPAYADWTAAPQALSVHDAGIAQKACASQLSDLHKAAPAPGEPAGEAPLTVSERRGDYVLLEYATAGLTKVDTCLVTLKANTTKVSHVDVASGGGSGASTARVNTINTSTEMSMGDPQLTLVTGVAGQGVRAVTLHSGSYTIQASVKNGVYTAVWPGSYAKRVANTLVNTLTYDITLNNGTVIKNAPTVG